MEKVREALRKAPALPAEVQSVLYVLGCVAFAVAGYAVLILFFVIG